MWATSPGSTQKWGGLLSLSGIKEISYKQLYKNYPYTSNSVDGLKMDLGWRNELHGWIPGAKTCKINYKLVQF